MKTTLALLATILLVAGCANFATNTFRAEQTVVNLVHTAYVGYTNSLLTHPIDPALSNQIKSTRLKLAGALLVLDQMRAAYETNSALEPQVQAVLDAVQSQATNILMLINEWKASNP